MKYKAGDKLRVKKDLEEGKCYGKYVVTDSMSEMAGKIVTVETANSNSYEILEDSNKYFWSDEMFEENIKLTKKELFDMPIGTKIKIKKDNDTFTIFIKVENEKFVEINDCDEILDKDDIENDLSVDNWIYNKIIEVQEPTYSIVYIEAEEDKKEMTISEIEEKLGYPIKIVKEK